MMTNPVRKITQGQFSFLPELTDAEIALQIEYGLNKGCRAVARPSRSTTSVWWPSTRRAASSQSS